MWGEHAVGKLVAGADRAAARRSSPSSTRTPTRRSPSKVKRRLGHWIDRKIARALPAARSRSATTRALTGMARGIAFRLVEALGVMPARRDRRRRQGARPGRARQPAQARRALRPVHGLPAAAAEAGADAAPARALVAGRGLDVFPEAPPPGLVTVPAVPGAPAGYYPRAGYRLAGERAIRIDMLERLADLIRNLDARSGFEATPDMLSITGLTLEQFAKLMQGLGYQASEATRPKRKPAPWRRARRRRGDGRRAGREETAAAPSVAEAADEPAAAEMDVAPAADETAAAPSWRSRPTSRPRPK